MGFKSSLVYFILPVFKEFKQAYCVYHAGWDEGPCFTSRRLHEAVLRVIVPPAEAPALCHHGRAPTNINKNLFKLS